MAVGGLRYMVRLSVPQGSMRRGIWISEGSACLGFPLFPSRLLILPLMSTRAESFTRLQDVVRGRALCHGGLESASRISPATQVLPAAGRAPQVLASIPSLGYSVPLSLWSVQDALGTGPASPRLWGREKPAHAALVLTVPEGEPSCCPGPLSCTCPRRLLPRRGTSHLADLGLGGITG